MPVFAGIDKRLRAGGTGKPAGGAGSLWTGRAAVCQHAGMIDERGVAARIR